MAEKYGVLYPQGRGILLSHSGYGFLYIGLFKGLSQAQKYTLIASTYWDPSKAEDSSMDPSTLVVLKQRVVYLADRQLGF